MLLIQEKLNLYIFHLFLVLSINTNPTYRFFDMIVPMLLLSSDLEIRHAAGMIIATKDQKNFFGDGSHMLGW